MGTEFSTMELAFYRSVVEADPQVFRVAHCSLNPRALSAPVGIFVHKTNPIQRLTVQQVARIFTTGQPAGDVTHWGQLGLTGEWPARSVHPCGIAEEASSGLAGFMLKKMGGQPFTPSYDGFAQSADVVRRVGEDPEAIGFASANIQTREVKMLSISARDGDGYISVTPASIMSGKYPYDRYLLIYVRHTPGELLDQFAAEYLRMVLSKEGQTRIAAAPPGYLPLNARQVAQQLSKLP
jgi:phosphate transport system substrate-binding protein